MADTREHAIEKMGQKISAYSKNSEVAWEEDSDLARELYDAGYRLPVELEVLTEVEKEHIANALKKEYGDEWCSCCDEIVRKLGLAADKTAEG